MTKHRPGMLVASVLVILTACGPSGPYGGTPVWDGRLGYDGRGDYGYDLAASRAEASTYRAQAARDYSVPGTPNDPWGPYVREAGARFGVPELWVREVMRQESGGRLYAADGSLITSSAGAMGLMQVMPETFDQLRLRHGLGGDPYEPRDNILAGAAFIRDMYDRFGAPLFLAAYNAGPQRVEAYLAGGQILPDETENYLARVTPRLGTAPAAGTPSYVAASGSHPHAYVFRDERTSAADPAPILDNAANRAFEGGGLVTASSPTGVQLE